MKRKLFLLLALMLGLVSSIKAQTDVTSTYITNPSFESDGAISTSNAALTITGWTQSNPGGSYNNTGCYDKDTNLPTQGTVTVTPSNGDYLLFFRHGWNGSGASYTFTSSSTTLPAGAYTLSVDYKMVEGYDNTQNNKTTVTIAAVSGETSLGSATGTTKTNVSGGSDYTYLNTADWSTATANFVLEEATENVQFVITLFAGGQRRSDFVVDNVKLLQTEYIDPTAIAVDDVTLIPTAKKTLSVTYTPTDANHNTAITWESLNESVATVSSEGVVTAVAAGTATIKATTANSVSTTCTVTVNEIPLANGDYYILNVSKGEYLGGANSWGTQASIIKHGIPFTATLANGVYTLDSKTYNSDSNHFLNGTYVDSGSTNIYITALGDGKYSISTADGSAFLTANNDNTTVANTADNATNELAQWKFVTKAELEAALASATSTSPVDATFYIADQNFSRNYWPAGRNTSSWTWTTTNQNLKGGNNENMCAETFQNGGGKIYQTLTVPNGQYGVKCQGFYRQDSGETPSYLYANDEKKELKVFNGGGEGTTANMAGASTSFSAGLYQLDELTVNVTNGSLTVGIEGQGGNWTCFDNLELNYYGPNIAGEAEELPTTDMTAGNWYYFDIAVGADYNLKTTTLNDIVYTTDGTILIENEGTVTANFGANPNALTVGRYYVKSSSAQALTVKAAYLVYELGDATLSVADGGYTQSSTFAVTFPNAQTTDPDAELALVASSTATVNGNSVALSAVDKGFSLDLGSLAANTDYVIAIPADVYGYADESMNSAINVTIHTPAVFDGEYCLYDATNKLFLGRGAAWGTEAVTDKYGIPFNLVTDTEGKSTIEFVDWTGVYLFSTDKGKAAGMYTDNASTGWVFVPTTGGYYLKDANGDVYAKVDNGDYGYYAHTVAGSANATVWTLKTKAERDAIIAAYPTDNVNNVIEASGISTTADAFVTYLSENYSAENYTSKIGTATFAGSVGDWAWSQVRGQNGQPAYGTNFAEVWCATGSFTQTISDLPAGIYKLTVQGYERRKDNNAATALYNAGYNVVSTFMSANNEQVRFTDWNEVEGKPTNTGGAVTAFENGEAVNTLYVYLDGTEDLTITVKKPNYIWDCWTIFNNFTLTYYSSTVSAKIGDTGWTTFASPCALDLSKMTASEGDVTAFYASNADAEKVSLESTDQAVAAGTGLMLKGTAGATITIPVVASGDAIENLLVGCTTETVLPANENHYVLVNNGGKAEFESLKTSGATIPAGKAYLNAGVSAARLVISIDGETAINAIDAAEIETEGLKDGKYLIEGKIVIVNNGVKYSANGQILK